VAVNRFGITKRRKKYPGEDSDLKQFRLLVTPTCRNPLRDKMFLKRFSYVTKYWNVV
jgi:hypothetical protein